MPFVTRPAGRKPRSSTPNRGGGRRGPRASGFQVRSGDADTTDARSIPGRVFAQWEACLKLTKKFSARLAVAILGSLSFTPVAVAQTNAGVTRAWEASLHRDVAGSAGRPGPEVRKEIVGGGDVPAGSWQSLAFVYHDAGFSCTGTVVAPNVVLTAGHCAEDTATGSPYSPSGYHIVTGSPDWTDTSTRQVSAVSQVSVYPSFDISTLQGDAALLVLSTPTTAPPMTLATGGDIGLLTPGNLGYIVGWGLTAAGNQSIPTFLQSATTAIQGASYCDGQIGTAFDSSSEVCAVDAPNYAATTCNGDSGGPLVAADANNNTVEVGITSQGDVNCDPSQPDIFTRVDAISSWANDVINSVAPQEPTPTPSSPRPLGGLYRGRTSQRYVIGVRVAYSNSAITGLDLSYRLTCRVHHRHLAYRIRPLGGSSSPWQIVDSGGLGFSQYFTDADGTRYHIIGTFSTHGTVSGTVHVVWHTHRYGVCDSGTVRWRANR
jgi:secreted trypsin-like serine protease